MRWQIFYKWNPLEFGFCVGNCSKILEFNNSGPIGRPPNTSNRPTIWGPKYKKWHFFNKLTPFQFGFCLIYDRKFSNLSIFGRLADSLFFKAAQNMDHQIVMKVVCNYIGGHTQSQGGLKFATQISPLLYWQEETREV